MKNDEVFILSVINPIPMDELNFIYRELESYFGFIPSEEGLMKVGYSLMNSKEKTSMKEYSFTNPIHILDLSVSEFGRVNKYSIYKNKGSYKVLNSVGGKIHEF